MKNVSLEIPTQPKMVIRKFKLSQNLLDELDLYIEAAREDVPSVTDSMVVQACLEKQIKMDRSFNAWLQKNKQVGSDIK